MINDNVYVKFEPLQMVHHGEFSGYCVSARWFHTFIMSCMCEQEGGREKNPSLSNERRGESCRLHKHLHRLNDRHACYFVLSDPLSKWQEPSVHSSKLKCFPSFTKDLCLCSASGLKRSSFLYLLKVYTSLYSDTLACGELCNIPSNYSHTTRSMGLPKQQKQGQHRRSLFPFRVSSLHYYPIKQSMLQWLSSLVALKESSI